MPPKIRVDPCPVCGHAVTVDKGVHDFYIKCPVVGGQTHYIIVRGASILAVVKLWNWKHKTKE